MSRFQPKIKHYHKKDHEGEVSWDDWVGDKRKSPFRKKINNFFLQITVAVTGLVLALAAFYFFMKIMKVVINQFGR